MCTENQLSQLDCFRGAAPETIEKILQTGRILK